MTASESSVSCFDTSALLKRYHPEAGFEVVDAAFDVPGAVRWISDLGIVEGYSALTRRILHG